MAWRWLGILMLAAGFSSCLRSPLEPAAPASTAGKDLIQPVRVEQLEVLDAHRLPLRPLPLAAGLRHPGRGPETEHPASRDALAQQPAAREQAVEPVTTQPATGQDLASRQDREVDILQAADAWPATHAGKRQAEAAAPPPSAPAAGHAEPHLVQKDSQRHTDPAPLRQPQAEALSTAPAPASSSTLAQTHAAEGKGPAVADARVAAKPATARSSDLAMATVPVEEVEHEADARDAEDAPAPSRPRLGADARFQVQIMSTSDPEGAEDMRLQAELVFPGDVVEVVWDPPNYKVRVGGAATMEAAQELKRRALRLGFTNAWVVPRRTS